jgi:uncharacterized protein
VTVSLFTFVDLFSRAAGNADHLLNRGAQHAQSEGRNPEEILDWRLIGDMHPLRFQVMVVANFATQWPARVAGLPVHDAIGDQLDLAGLKAALADARSYLSGLTAEQFAGRDDVPLSFAIGPGMEPTLPSGQWLTVFAASNLYFHLTTTYAILRAKGVPLGKRDLFATGL